MSRKTNQGQHGIHLQNFLARALDFFQRFCFCNGSGQLIAARCVAATDLNQMIDAGLQIREYLKPQNGDVFLTNDPTITGCGPNEYLTVLFFSPDNRNDELFYVCEKFSVGDQLWIPENSNFSTQPIPPVPIFTQEESQNEIIEAMGSGLGPFFVERLQRSLQNLLLTRVQVLDLCLWRSSLLDPKSLKDLFNSTSSTVQNQIEELRMGSNSVEIDFLESKFSLEIQKEDELVFDFSKSRFAEPFAVSEKDLLSIVSVALAKSLGVDFPLNQGLLNFINLKLPRLATPKRSTKNNSYLHLVGSPIWCELITSCMAPLHHDGHRAQNTMNPMLFCFEFKNGSAFSRPFFGGGGASVHLHGKKGWNPWINAYGSMSIEHLERSFPIQVNSIVPRPQSGGRGDKNGGEGVSWTIKFLDEGRVYWLQDSEDQKLQAKGSQGGKAGQPGLIKIIRSKEEIELNESPQGFFDFQKMDVLKISTPGGGGFGTPPTSDHLS